MKKSMFMLPVLAAAVLFSCKPDEPQGPSEIKVLSEPVTVEFNTEKSSFDYEITNPRKGAAVAVTSNVAWVKNFDYSTDGVVSFDIAKNEEKEERQARLTVAYVEGNQTLSSTTLSVSQTAFPNSKISLKTPSPMTVFYDGGDCSIEYRISRPQEGGIFDAQVDADWITDMDYATDGIITFKVAENREKQPRKAIFTLNYSVNSELIATTTFELNQIAYSNPTIAFKENPMTVGFEKGSYTVPCTVTDPVEGCAFIETPSVSWISYASVKGGELTFHVDANSGDERRGSIKIDYQYGEDILATATFEVIQEKYVLILIPSIKLNPTSLTAEPDGGAGSFEYEIENPEDGAVLSAVSSVDWITDVVVGDGTVTYKVAKNPSETEARQGNINLTYTRNSEVRATASIRVMQSAATTPDYEFQPYSKSYFGWGINNNNKPEDFTLNITYLGTKDGKYQIRWELCQIVSATSYRYISLEMLVEPGKIDANKRMVVDNTIYSVASGNLIAGEFKDGAFTGSFAAEINGTTVSYATVGSAGVVKYGLTNQPDNNYINYSGGFNECNGGVNFCRPKTEAMPPVAGL